MGMTNWKRLYTDASRMLDKYQNEVVPKLREQLANCVEVVHGRWKYYHKQNIAVCTNCSFERDLDANFGKAVSCPNCGAKMDGDENE